jgi:hypothetical protein
MKRIILTAALVAAASLAGLWPFSGTDAAQVVPVETLCIRREGNIVRVLAEDGLTGSGDTLAAALGDLAEGAPGKVFFGTVQRVILTRDALPLVKDLLSQGGFRPSVWVYLTEGTIQEGDPAVLRAHETNQEIEATLSRVLASDLGGPAVTVAQVTLEEGSWQLQHDG